MSLLNIPVSNPSLVKSTTELINQPQHLSFINQEGSGKNKKQINKYKKESLIKLAKECGINCKTKDGKLRTKEQIFRSLKRKKMI